MTATIRAVPNLRSNLRVMIAATWMRILNVSRYPGMLAMDIILPIIVASMPILLGRASGGADASEIFAANTGTANYVGYMMIGAASFSIVSSAFWLVAWWIRWEMETGTIEAIYLAPVNRIWIAAGISLYAMVRAFGSGIMAYFLGSWIYGSNPFQGELLLALAFILIGLIPLYGMTLIFGALVLKLKEANAVISLMQWAVSFLMGVFFPLAVLPKLVQYFAMLFPPTWMTNAVRSAILGVGYFFGEWYFDMAVLGVFLIVSPMLGAWIFAQVENNVRRNEGVGKF